MTQKLDFAALKKNYFFSCRCGERKVVRTRIVGGQNAQKNEYPWQVGDGGEYFVPLVIHNRWGLSPIGVRHLSVVEA